MFSQANVPMTLAISKQSAGLQDRIQIPGNINRALIKICILLVNLEPEKGETGLHLAACKNNEKMISFLLDLGASPNMVDLKGRSPAMRAAEFGHVQALTLLTEADTNLTSKEFNIIFV